MRFIMLLLLLTAPVYGGEITPNIPEDVLAVRALIEKFDTPGFVDVEGRGTIPAFALYAEEVATYGECAVDPLIEALGEEGQIRVAAAIALDIIGPASIKATPQIIKLLGSTVDRDNILGCGICRGIGRDAVGLVPQLLPLLDADNFHVQYWACRALSSIGPGAYAATDGLNRLLLNGVASARRNAAIALGSIAPGMTQRQLQETRDALTAVAETDGCHPVRIEAIAALKKIADFQAQVD